MANYIHETVKIAKLTSIESSIKGSDLSIGANTIIDDFVKIKFVGGIGNIIIGENVYLNSGTVIYSGNGLIIGNNVLIGPNCSLTAVNHEFKSKSLLIREQKFMKSKGGIEIGDDVWIGACVTVLDGTKIGKGAVISANSMVNSIIEEYSINIGIPCRCVGFRK